MGRLYTINLSPTAITVAADLVEIQPADDLPILIHGFRVWQTSDFGDAQDEILTLSWVRGNTTSGSGGNTGVTPAPKNHRDAAAGMTVETANTTAASAGTAVTPYSTGWNVRAPLEVVFTPEQRIRADQGNTIIVLRMGAAPADSLTIGCSVDVEEL
ncbi:MAG TPA: hypothetical protein VFD32_05530 [Dehalococcoidia bacterium]|nr:hypothetical protein [Dehalococcoidia bacterium]